MSNPYLSVNYNPWNEVYGAAARALPRFNDDLLVNFREEKIKQVPEFLSIVFKEAVKLFAEYGYTVECLGYSELNPEERAAYTAERGLTKSQVDIQKSNYRLVRFDFKFMDEIFPVYVHIPYLDQAALVEQDTHYYPLLPIVEKGIHRTLSEIVIKVMRLPLTAWRRVIVTLNTVEGQSRRQAVPTIRVHQGSTNSKLRDTTPLVLYHFAMEGFNETLKMYGLNKGDITLVTEATPTKGYQHQFIPITGMYIKFKDEILDDLFKIRLVASLYMMLSVNTKYTVEDVIGKNSKAYFKLTLGKYTDPTGKELQLMNNVDTHLNTCRTLLDPPAQTQLDRVGVHVKDFSELLYSIYYNIDKWSLDYTPSDLYDKKIASPDQMLYSSYVRLVFKKVYEIQKYNNSSQGLNRKAFTRFTRQISKQYGICSNLMALRGNPTIYHANALITILSKYFRSFDNLETKADTRKKRKRVSAHLIAKHPSHVVVTSVLAIPSSNPGVSGSIGPYAPIDKEGNFYKPEWANKFDHVFD